MEPQKGIRIPNPCHAPWEEMTPQESGKFCSLCSKTVTDFTSKTTSEIREFFSKLRGRSVCGRFRKDQLEPEPEQEVSRRLVGLTPPLWIFAVAIFMAFGASLFNMDRHPLTQPDILPDETKEQSEERTVVGVIIPNQRFTAGNRQTGFTDPIDVTERKDSLKNIRVGRPEKTTGPDTLWSAEVLPEFPGGKEGLLKFLQNAIKYPEAERDSGMSAKVYVKFLIDTSGRIVKPEIIKASSPAFGKEVLRVVKTMPNFTPARQNGRVVASYYVLPVIFELR